MSLHTQLFIKSIKKLEQELYTFNLNHGQNLNDGLEDKIDQLQNLLEKHRKDLEK